MTLAEFLADPDRWLGRSVTIEGCWLHCLGVRGVVLTDGPLFERPLVAVRARWAAAWMRSHIPSRPGAPTAHFCEASVTGTMEPPVPSCGAPLPPTADPVACGVPILGGEVSVVLQYSGRLYLRAPTVRAPRPAAGLPEPAGVPGAAEQRQAEPGAAADPAG